MAVQFKVLSGNHHEGNKEYLKGDIITTDRPLDQIFKNKFERLGTVDAPAPKAEAKKEAGPVRTKKIGYKTIKVGKNLYDVVNKADDKSVNEEPLSLKEAEKLIETLSV